MNYGLALPYGSAQSFIQYTRAAEKAGWDGCFSGDAIWCEDPMIALAAAAVQTERIRLGITIIPVPLRRPWKLASESVSVDHLSNGRLILGLGTGAVWMGWHAFPDEVTDNQTRAEMLDETIDILTLFYQRKPFDYDGKHYHLRLSLLDEVYYPPTPIQQPRIPLWCVGIWPRKKSMRRTLKCDGVIVEKRNSNGEPEAAAPDDIAAIKAFIDAERQQTTPFDIVVGGKTIDLDPTQMREKMLAYEEAGATWWLEELYDQSEDVVFRIIQDGPPIRKA